MFNGMRERDTDREKERALTRISIPTNQNSAKVSSNRRKTK
jgi:hypothetical protein